MVGVDPDPVPPLQPGHQLRGGPGPAPGVQQRLHRPEVALRHPRRAAGARAVDQGREARGQEGLDVPADRLLVAAQVGGDAGHAPAGVGQADRLQAVAGAGGEARRAGAGAQLRALRLGQRHADHGGVPPRPPFYERITSTCLVSSALAAALPGGRRALAQPAAPEASPDAAGYAVPEWLVDAAWLADRLGDATVKVVALTPPGDFAAGHVPGAAQIDWPELEVTDTSDPSIVRWQGEVEAALTELGLGPSDTVVVYDGGTLWAARLWWILDQLGHRDKRLLNGGLAAWTAAGGELETGESSAQPATAPYRGTPNPATLAPLDLVVARLDDPNVALVDARSAEEYRTGHIPGAVSVDFPLNAEPEEPKTWKPAAELRSMYAELGVTRDKLVVPYCTTGVRSAVTYFTLRLIGYPEVRLFTGSWKEWSSHPELPVATGERP